MVLFLTETDIARSVTLEDAVRGVERAMRALADGEAVSCPRERARGGESTPLLHVMAGAHGPDRRVGVKAYVTGRWGARFWILHWNEAGELLAIMEGDKLGQLRTGAATGVATRHMARKDAAVVTQIGTGWQAYTQLAAVCLVRPIRRAYVWSRNLGNAQRFVEAVQPVLGEVIVEPVDDVSGTVKETDVLNLTTRANEPVVFGSWLKRGLHINAVGSNRASARELDTEAVRGSRVVVDLKTQACKEAGDLIGAAREGAFNWDDAAELAAVVAGTQPGRTREEEVTIFSSQGMGLWDVALAEIAYQRALAQGLGTRLPIPPTGGSFPSDSLSPL